MTQDEARKYFDYDPESGELKNRIRRNSRAPAGAKAGCTGGKGYLQVRVNSRLHKVHRVIWLWVYGYFPEHQIDHINRNPSDNRLENLREVTPSCNTRNSSQKTNNNSGVTGVHWYERHEKWQAQIKANNRQYHLGYFQDFAEAVKARHQAEVKYEWPGCNSSTDAYQYLKENHEL